MLILHMYLSFMKSSNSHILFFNLIKTLKNQVIGEVREVAPPLERTRVVEKYLMDKLVKEANRNIAIHPLKGEILQMRKVCVCT